MGAGCSDARDPDWLVPVGGEKSCLCSRYVEEGSQGLGIRELRLERGESMGREGGKGGAGEKEEKRGWGVRGQRQRQKQRHDWQGREVELGREPEGEGHGKSQEQGLEEGVKILLILSVSR